MLMLLHYFLKTVVFSLLFALMVPVFQASADDKEHVMSILTTWAGGFGRNLHGGPYLLSEEHRAVLFPRAASSSVVSLEKSTPILDVIRANLAELVNVDRIDLDLNSTVPGKEDEVAAFNVGSDSTTFRMDTASASSDLSLIHI